MTNEYLELNKEKLQFLKKSKVQLIMERDQNASYYHSFMKTKRNTNKIFRIKYKQGKHHLDMKNMSRASIEYYMELIGSYITDR